MIPRISWALADQIDRFADRDAHHASVRRWLDLLQALGLIRWQAGINDAGEEARTEIALLEVPGTHFHAALEGVTLPTADAAASSVAKLLEAGARDGGAAAR